LYSSLQRQQWEQSVDQHRHQTRGRFVGFLSLLGERRGARYYCHSNESFGANSLHDRRMPNSHPTFDTGNKSTMNIIIICST
jgi:hypothetical protein